MNLVSNKNTIPTLPQEPIHTTKDKSSKNKRETYNRLKNSLKFLNSYNKTYFKLFDTQELLDTSYQKHLTVTDMKSFLQNILTNNKNDNYIKNIDYSKNSKNHISVHFLYYGHSMGMIRITKNNLLILDVKEYSKLDNQVYVFTVNSFLKKFKTIHNFFHFQYPEFFAANKNLYKQFRKYVKKNIILNKAQGEPLMLEKELYIDKCINKIILNRKKTSNSDINEFNVDILNSDNIKNYNYENNYKEAVDYLFFKYMKENNINHNDILISHIKYRRN